jgi:hypothetical protein
LGLCLALKAFEQGGIFIVPHLQWQRALVFQFHPKDCPIKSTITTHKGKLRIESYPDPHRSHTADGKGSAKWSEKDRCCMWGHRRLRTPYALLRQVESELLFYNRRIKCWNNQLLALGQLHKNWDTCCHNCFPLMFLSLWHCGSVSRSRKTHHHRNP